ncbi:MAG: hypothetical protein ACREA0_20810, partial [bacterium]
MLGLFVIALGAYQQEGDAAASDQQAVAETAQAQSDPSTVAQTSERPEARGSIDTDGDGVADVDDRCEDTVAGMGVGADGCRNTGMVQDPIDKDEDLVADYLDKCPMTVEGAKVDEKGCEIEKPQIEKPQIEKPQIEKPLARLEDVLFEAGGV